MGGFDESLIRLEDTDYCFRVQRAGQPLSFAPGAVVHIRDRPGFSTFFMRSVLWSRDAALLYKRYANGATLDRPWRNHLYAWRSVLLDAWRIRRREDFLAWTWRFGCQVGVLIGTVVHRSPPVPL